jgi:hypothetical protein
MAHLPSEYVDKVNKQEGCLITKVAPQWRVLEHPATGFFVVSHQRWFSKFDIGNNAERQSHCGSNSTAEAIMHEVPMIAMPLIADQAEFATMREFYL